jgi:hypothetical protein
VDVHFDSPPLEPGHIVYVLIDRVSPLRTHGTLLSGSRSVVPLTVLKSDI